MVADDQDGERVLGILEPLDEALRFLLAAGVSREPLGVVVRRRHDQLARRAVQPVEVSL
jgi:hypothetical protein